MMLVSVRRRYFTIALGMLILLCHCTNRSELADTRPNIILISADDLGWSDIGCYGSEINTPNLDQLAQEGMRFTQFYNTAKCFPSRACLITGLYAQDCGYSQTHTNPLRNAVTIGEVLRSAGYATYWAGKHHGKDNPYDRGFDHYYGLKDGACNHFNPGVRRKDEAPPAQKRNDRAWCIDAECYEPYTPEGDFYTTDYFTKYAIDYVREAEERGKPFFMYVAYTAPHDPLMAWPEDIAKYRGKYDVGYDSIRQLRYEKQINSGLLPSHHTLSTSTFTKWAQLSDEKRQFEAKKMEVYAAMIDRLDQNVGKIVSTLRELNLLENTLIVFVSDNGASAEVVNLKTDDDTAEIGSMGRWLSLGGDWANVSNTPYRYFKNYSYEGGIKTPMIAFWPGKISANSFSDYPGHFIDMLPTFMELAEAEYPHRFKDEKITPLRGQSLLPILKGGNMQRKYPLYFAWQDGSALRLGKYKIVKHGLELPWQLYDMSTDPTELNDLATRYPTKVQELDSLYEIWWEKY